MSEENNYKGIMLSKRANVYYLEHTKVVLVNDVVMFMCIKSNQAFNIPNHNTAFVLLGKGTSITDSAARKLADSNVMLGFCGSGGSPLISCTDITFFYPDLCDKPTKYIQEYIKKWVNPESRFLMSKKLFELRVDINYKAWENNKFLKERSIKLPDKKLILDKVHKSVNIQQLMGHEGIFAKHLYHLLAKGCSIANFKREQDATGNSLQDKVNKNLNYGNYLAYGYASVALNGLGLNHGFPLLHGMTRKNALIFDIADLIKDAYIMPFAFSHVINSKDNEKFRKECMDMVYNNEILDILFDSLKTIVLV